MKSILEYIKELNQRIRNTKLEIKSLDEEIQIEKEIILNDTKELEVLNELLCHNEYIVDQINKIDEYNNKCKHQKLNVFNSIEIPLILISFASGLLTKNINLFLELLVTSIPIGIILTEISDYVINNPYTSSYNKAKELEKEYDLDEELAKINTLKQIINDKNLSLSEKNDIMIKLSEKKKAKQNKHDCLLEQRKRLTKYITKENDTPIEEKPLTLIKEV